MANVYNLGFLACNVLNLVGLKILCTIFSFGLPRVVIRSFDLSFWKNLANRPRAVLIKILLCHEIMKEFNCIWP